MAIRPRPAPPVAAAEPATAALAGVGHNRPPPDEQARIDFNEAIRSHKVDLRGRIAELLGSASRATANDDESTGLCAELIRQMSAVEKAVDDARVAVKAPYLAGSRAIDDAAKTIVADLGSAKGKVRTMAEDFMRKKAAQERARLAQEEAERQAARDRAAELAEQEVNRAADEGRLPDTEVIAALDAVGSKPVEAEPTQIRSDYGAVASARKIKVATVTDWTKAFKAVRTVPAVQEAIQKAINGLVRAGQTAIPGVEITDDIGLSVR